MLLDIVTVLPEYSASQRFASEELKKRMASQRPAVARLLDAAAFHSGIEKRHVVVLDADDKVNETLFPPDGNPSTDARMKKFRESSSEMAIKAAGCLIDRTKTDPKKINRIITISCTGFFAPGLDYLLMEHFNIDRRARRTNIGFMGCAASIIGFSTALDALKASDVESNILMLSVELCSLHLQFSPSKDNILSNTIFSDGCAALMLTNNKERSGRLELIDTRSILFDDSADFMAWEIGDTGFNMKLSSELPSVILNTAVPALKNLLSEMGVQNVSHWALHPGGRAILDSLQQGLGLRDESMQPSREVLRKCGNMSSASILFVMKEILDNYEIKKGEYLCAVAFGPGLTMEAAVFRGI